MPDWFFDPDAAGTGSGSSAADAFTNCNSWFALQNSANGLAFGDRVWFRRTSQASMTPSSAQWGRQGWSVINNPYGWFIGWPKSGEPFYDARPGDARSAGWDLDVNTYVNTDINMAVWAHVNDPHPSAPVTGWGIANICVSQISGTNRTRMNSSFYNPKRNLHFLNVAFTAMFNFDGVSITSSQHQIMQAPVGGGRLTLTASSVVNTAIFGEGQLYAINELVTDTNSYRALHANNLNGSDTARRSEINVWRGNKPNQGNVSVANNRWNSTPTIIYDFFGEGPYVMCGGGWIPSHRLISSADVAVNSQPIVSAIEVSSQGGSNYLVGGARFYGEPYMANADARAYISVNCGIPVHVRWPIMNVHSLVVDPVIVGAPIEMIVQGPGGRTLQAHSLTPTSVSSWSGNSVSAGSAWLAEFNWVPGATGDHFIDLLVGRVPGRSGYAYIGYPLVNSA
jgi:hypothetical protein